tara:strand:- start:1245 stop:1871 length:627 start_codon:yes stop_codon:yes gene_type:complete
LLEEYKIVFWDFDGVIKDSVNVKSQGYEKLFSTFGKELVGRVNKHHQFHGGVSRLEKIPLYLAWAGQPSNPAHIQKYCERFSRMVQQAVIDSPWVPGVQEYLRSNKSKQCFILITGTPQEEIERILQALELTSCFSEVHGAPKKKAVVIKEILKRLHYLPNQALVVGDSGTDFEAARDNSVAFLLRRTPFNHELQEKFKGPSFEKLKS